MAARFFILCDSSHHAAKGFDEEREDEPGPDGEGADGAEERIEGHRFIEAGEAAADVISDAGSEEPDAHDETDDLGRGQFGHGGEADGAETELADGVQEVRKDEPKGADLDAILGEQGTADEREKSGTDEDEAEDELGGDGGFLRAELEPEPAEHGCHRDEEDGVQRLEHSICDELHEGPR